MRKKVLHVLSSRKYSGAENVAATVITICSDEFELAYTSPSGPIEEVLYDRGVNYHPMQKLSIFELRKVIKSWEPDMIHAHDFSATLISLLAASSIPVISHIHQNPNWLKKINLKSIVFFFCWLKASRIILVNSSIGDSNFIFSKLNNKNLVIENIVDIDFIRNRAISCEKEDYDIAYVGRLVDIKNPIRFINIMSDLVKLNPDLRAVLVGDGNLRTDCENMIKERKLEKNVFLAGFKNNPFPILNNSKILVMTSKSEGLPMTAIEALALGKPVFVPDLQGIDKIIDDDCGKICKNDTDFITNLNSILKDQDLYLLKSKNAHRKAEKLFDIQEYRSKISEVYNYV